MKLEFGLNLWKDSCWTLKTKFHLWKLENIIYVNADHYLVADCWWRTEKQWCGVGVLTYGTHICQIWKLRWSNLKPLLLVSNLVIIATFCETLLTDWPWTNLKNNGELTHTSRCCLHNNTRPSQKTNAFSQQHRIEKHERYVRWKHLFLPLLIQFKTLTCNELDVLVSQLISC